MNTTIFYCGNLALETFVFISVFFISYKCIQIMNAKNGLLSAGDVVCIWMRKFLRLAPVYYFMWAAVWALTSRLIEGPISYKGNINMATCSTEWRSTLFMVGNLFPEEMEPYKGCFQQAWPLQVDMQITLVVPFISMIIWKVPVLGILICLALIVGNFFINFAIAQHYGLKIGFLHHDNYFLLQGIIAKPWTKISCIGFGVLLAYIYHNILGFREQKTDEDRQKNYPVINWFRIQKKWIGWAFIIIGLTAIFGNLALPVNNYADPNAASDFMNAFYFGFSRPAWVFGIFCVCIAIFTGKFGIARAILANGNMRAVGKSIIVCSVF